MCWPQVSIFALDVVLEEAPAIVRKRHEVDQGHCKDSSTHGVTGLAGLVNSLKAIPLSLEML